MNIDKYNALANDINDSYRCPNLLPVMKSSLLYITTKTVASSELANEVGTNYSQGWQLYTDDLKTSPVLQSGCTLLEAEFSNEKSSLKIKLLHDDKYQVTRYSSESGDIKFESLVYYDQLVKIRRRLRENGQSNARYRFWYRESKGRWEAMAQQFIEFTGEEK